MEKEENGKDSIKYKSGRLYRESYKVSVLSELVMGEESDSFVARKHGLTSSSIFNIKQDQLSKHGYFRILDEMKKNKKTSDSADDLAAENAKLKKALELATLKVAALETLIDVAEDRLNVDIRKKTGSKQSK